LKGIAATAPPKLFQPKKENKNNIASQIIFSVFGEVVSCLLLH